MKIFIRKKTAIALTLILSATITLSIFALPLANAHTPPWEIPTFAFVQVAPNPVGAGQTIHVFVWLNTPYDGAALSNNFRFHNYKVTITDPDNQVTTKTYDTVQDTTSSQYFTMIPDKVGTYTFNFSFPGQNVNDYPHANDAYVNDTYLPSSASTTLTVQEEQLPNPISSYPLPQEYWSRPIYGENNDWWSISSNWLGQTVPGYGGVDHPGARQDAYPGDAVGPQTSHIMWTKPLQSGGVVGGNSFEIQGNTYFEGSAYNQRFANPIVLDGKLYYTEPLSFAGAPNSGFAFGGGTYGPTVCVDLRTGKVIWSRTDVPPLSFGYIYDVEDPNQHGVYPPILFTTNFAQAFDADTGTALFNVTGVPSGTTVLGPQGEHLRYVIANAGNSTNPDWRLGEWNSSKLWGYVYPPNIAPTLTGIVNTPTGTAVDASISNPSDPNSRYDWNVSISFADDMPVPPPNFFNPNPTPFTVFGAYYNNMLLCYNGSLPNVFNAVTESPYTYFAINLNTSRGHIGDVLWWNTITPTINVSVNVGASDPTVGVFVEGYRETRQWVGYSMSTGQKMWDPTPSQSPWDYYGNTGVSIVQGAAAYGKLYSSGFGGILYCYDMANGDLLWTYGNGGVGNTTNSGFYTAYGDYPTFISAIGNGVVYLITTEHTSTAPIYKGALARAVNATDGTEIWTLSDYTSTLAGPGSSPPSFAVADGFATFFNGYDNQIYSVGRGPSQTTISVKADVITQGNSVLIQGTVTDIASGTQQDEQAARFPNGVPVVSDVSMKDWMGYVYQQKPRPTDVTGVVVVISVLDSNNNTREIGRTTSDADGFYSLMWQPDITGKYTVFASFAGTNAYWPSQARTAFGVTEAPSTPESPGAPVDNTASYVTYAAVAIIIAIVVCSALIVLLLRKRP